MKFFPTLFQDDKAYAALDEAPVAVQTKARKLFMEDSRSAALYLPQPDEQLEL